MKNYDDIPLTAEEHTESYWHWPQVFTVPKGWDYMTDTELVYRTAPCDLEFDLQCAGDWLEIVNREKNVRICYRII